MFKIHGLIFLLIFSAFQAEALTIKKVKDKKVLLDISAGQVANNDNLTVYDANKKKVAELKVFSVKDLKAIAKVESGDISLLQLDALTLKVNSKKWKLDVTPRFFLNTFAVVQTSGTSTETVSMTGTNFGIGSEISYRLYEKFSVATGLSYDTLSVKATATNNVCGGQVTRNCFLDAKYLVFSGLIKYHFGSSNYWAGAGANFKLNMSKASNSLSESDISYANNVLLAGGTEFTLSGEKSYIPVSLNYEYSLNTSDKVTTISQYGLQAGYGIRF